MAKNLCVKKAMDDLNHSSPMPFIGLYIGGATLVCFLAMVSDILYGIRRRKPWLPCRFFKLNSLTLTLLSIATKLPVDLTTSMPSSHDQLSKLTGTALICISMGFFMPSLGIMSDKDGLANMASLTILILAVVVNVCIQISTGVIFSFIVEHIIILFCMLVLLLVLWFSMSTINVQKTICTDRTKELLLKGDILEQSLDSTMRQRLKLCYVHSYSSNPQLILFQTKYCAIIGILCMLSSVVLLETLLRSFVLKEFKFCRQVSDYGWSMKIVVVTQILTVLVGSVATGFRWLTFVIHMEQWTYSEADDMFVRSFAYEKHTAMLHYRAIRLSKTIFMKIFRLLEFLVRLEVILLQLGLYLMSAGVVWSSFKVREFFACAMRNTKNKSTDTMSKKFKDVFLSVEKGLEEWILRIDVEDMKRWIEVNKKEDSLKHLIQLLKIPPSEKSLVNDFQIVGQAYSPPGELVETLFGNYSYRMSCLSIVVLVLVTTALIPSTLSESLILTLDEVFEIIYFIDKKINAMSVQNKLTWMVTKDVWMDRYIFISWCQKKFMEGSQKENSKVDLNEMSQPQIELDRALGIVNELGTFNWDYLDPDMTVFTSFLNNRVYTSVEELYNHIVKLFVDMLHSHLINLPRAIFMDVVECPAEECEERVRLAMKFLCKLESLEAKVKVQWLFPDGTNITSLITAPAPTTDTHHGTQMESGDASVALPVPEDDDIVRDATVALPVTEDDDIVPITLDETIEDDEIALITHAETTQEIV